MLAAVTLAVAGSVNICIVGTLPTSFGAALTFTPSILTAVSEDVGGLPWPDAMDAPAASTPVAMAVRTEIGRMELSWFGMTQREIS